MSTIVTTTTTAPGSRPPTTTEASWLRAAGYSPSDHAGTAWWWIPPTGGEPLTTDEALETFSLSIRAGRDYRAGWRTSEFWATAVVVLPALAAGVAAITAPAAALPPPWNAVVGLGCLGVSATLTALYSQARAKVKGGVK
jgi:hypothetical protein